MIRLPVLRLVGVLTLACLFSLLAAPVGAAQPPALPAQPPAPPAQRPTPGFPVKARGAILVDFTTGQVLFEQGADVAVPPASLAKIMSLRLAFRAIAEGKIKPSDVITVSQSAWAQNFPGSSLMWLEPGQRVDLFTLMQGVAIPSGNDASVALAETLAGSVDAFVGQMNAEARRLGLDQLKFADPHGLSAAAQVTARQMALLAREYVKDFPQALADLHSQKEFTYSKIKQQNRNLLLWQCPTCDGLKTGYIPEAGYNLVATAKEGERRLLVVLLGTESEEARAQLGEALLKFGFANFANHQPLRPGETLAELRVWKGEADTLILVPQSAPVLTVARGDEATVERRVEAPSSAVAPVSKDQVLGNVTLVYQGREMARVPLVARDAVPLGGFFKRLLDSIRLLVKRWTNRQTP